MSFSGRPWVAHWWPPGPSPPSPRRPGCGSPRSGRCYWSAAGSELPEPDRPPLRADIVEGLRFLWHQRVLRALAAMTGIFNLATSATFAIMVLYAVGPDFAVGLSDTGYGLLLATLAGGSIIGSLLAAPVERIVAVRLARAQLRWPARSWSASRP